MYSNMKFDIRNLRMMNYGININYYAYDLLLTNEQKEEKKKTERIDAL